VNNGGYPEVFTAMREDPFNPHYSESVDNAGYLNDMFGKTGPYSKQPDFRFNGLSCFESEDV